jgi:REP element-mobilizing transposase RayT
MTPFDYRQSYRRKLPHIQTPGSTIFTTFRLFGSVPATVLNEYRNERMSKERQADERSHSEADVEFYRRWFLKIDAILDKAQVGPMWLKRSDVRSVVFEKILEDDVERYRLDAFSIMSNHVHALFQPNVKMRVGEIPVLERDSTLAKVMQSWKGASARECNRLLGRSGQFWDHESFDREIRGVRGFDRALRYTLRNPVKARLVRRPADWPGNYVSDRLLAEEWVRELWESPLREESTN